MTCCSSFSIESEVMSVPVDISCVYLVVHFLCPFIQCVVTWSGMSQVIVLHTVELEVSFQIHAPQHGSGSSFVLVIIVRCTLMLMPLYQASFFGVLFNEQLVCTCKAPDIVIKVSFEMSIFYTGSLIR